MKKNKIKREQKVFSWIQSCSKPSTALSQYENFVSIIAKMGRKFGFRGPNSDSHGTVLGMCVAVKYTYSRALVMTARKRPVAIPEHGRPYGLLAPCRFRKCRLRSPVGRGCEANASPPRIPLREGARPPRVPIEAK